MPVNYEVVLDVYQGPLDLLLQLIERQELDITLVSLALITDQYLAHLAHLKELSAANLATFLVIAARLLVIKSRVLLPREEEEADASEEEEWVDDLVDRLKEYKRFKEAAAYLGELAAAGKRLWPRFAPPPKMEKPPQFGEMRVEELAAAFAQVLEEHPPTPPVDPVVSPLVVRISDCVARILQGLRRYRRLRFSSLIKRARSRIEVIVTFLAMLELIKQRRIAVMQEKLFGEIYVQARTIDAAAEGTDGSEALQVGPE